MDLRKRLWRCAKRHSQAAAPRPHKLHSCSFMKRRSLMNTERPLLQCKPQNKAQPFSKKPFCAAKGLELIFRNKTQTQIPQCLQNEFADGTWYHGIEKTMLSTPKNGAFTKISMFDDAANTKTLVRLIRVNFCPKINAKR